MIRTGCHRSQRTPSRASVPPPQTSVRYHGGSPARHMPIASSASCCGPANALPPSDLQGDEAQGHQVERAGFGHRGGREQHARG